MCFYLISNVNKKASRRKKIIAIRILPEVTKTSRADNLHWRFTLASLQDIGFLNLKDSQFVEDVSTDIAHFQEVGNSYRVLVFPPFASYNRLLIHKVVETHFPDLVTFSVGEQFHRRTVIAFCEACHRGEKGLQLLSQPKEARTKQPSSSSSKWRNLTNQERVANWVRLREIKNRRREIWNSPKVLSISDLRQDDGDMSMENLPGEDPMEKARSKKQAAAVYVPPFLRARRGTDEPQENMNMNTSQSDLTESLNSTPQENKNNAQSSLSESLTSTPGENMNNSQSSFSESLSLSPQGQDSRVARVETPEEPKRPRGRGRGRRKPEIQVYVPKALREPKQELDKDAPGGLVSRRDVGGSNLESSMNSVGGKEEDVYNDCEIDDIEGHVAHIISEKDGEVASTVAACDTLQEHSSPVDDSVKSTALPPENSDDCVKKVLSVDCSGVPEDQNGDSDLTFEFYDPAVIAFMPSPKLPQEDGPSTSNINFGNPFYSEVPSTEVQQTGGLGTDSNHAKVDHGTPNCNPDPLVDTPDVVPVRGGVNERITRDDASKEPGKDCKGDNLCNDILSAYTTKDSIEKNSDDAASSKKKIKSETKKKKIKKKREGKSDSSTSEQGSVKQTKSKVKTKSRKSPPDEEAEEKLFEEKRSQSKRSSAEKEEEDGVDNGDTWDALFDDDGDCLDDSTLADITAHVGKVEIDRPKIDYLSYTPKEPDDNYEVFNHIVEIYDFPPEFGTHDIIGAFKDFISQGFDIKWVNDTHALGVFSSAIAAREALKVFHPMLKIRPMSEASRQGLSKAKSCQELLQPYKERPQTTSMAARRLVAGALGMAPKMSREMREQERNKLKAAKEKRKQEKQQKVDIWDGSFGKCAMDDV